MLLSWMTEAFENKGHDSARLSAEMLLAHVLGCDRLRLYMDADRPATPLERQSLRDLVTRALGHEPVQYLVGEAWFYGMALHVDGRVLIPRPSTETIVEQVLLHCRAEPGFGGGAGKGVVFADVCTGSGCIAVALLKNLPGAHALATDISADALAVAKLNAERHGVADRLDLLEGDLLEPVRGFPGGRDLHYIVSNPPYIPDSEWEDVEPNVRDYEPHHALRGGADGLGYVRRIIEEAPALLRPAGLLLVEVAASAAEVSLGLARSHPLLRDARVEHDHEGLPRVVVAHRIKGEP